MADEKIGIGLDSKEFEDGINNLKKKLKDIEKNVITVAGNIDASAKMLTKTTDSTAKSIDSLDKSTKKLDVSFKDFLPNIVDIGGYLTKLTAKVVAINTVITHAHHSFSSKLLPVLKRTIPLWSKWLIIVGSIYSAYKITSWAIKKFNEDLQGLNTTIEGKTQSLLLMHKGSVVELTKEYEKLRYELTDAQAVMIRDYDEAVNYFKQSNEALRMWWNLHSPWKYIERSIVTSSRNIVGAIGLTIGPYIEFQNALRKYDVKEWYKEVDLKTEADQLIPSLEAFIESMKKGKTTLVDVFNLAVSIKNAYVDTFNKIREAGQKTLDQMINRFGPFREFISLLSTGLEGPINNLEDLKEKLGNLGLSLQDIIDLSAAMGGIDMTPEQSIRLDELLTKIRAIVAAAKEGGGIPVIGLPERKPITPVGPPEESQFMDTKFHDAHVKSWKEIRELQKQGREDALLASTNMLNAAASWQLAAENLEEASVLTKAAALASGTAALANALAAKAIAGSMLNLPGFAAALAVVAAIIGLIAQIASFEEGGFVALGPETLPKIPQAAQGLITSSSVPDSGMLINVHGEELVAPLAYVGTLIGALAQKVFESKPIPAISGSGGRGDVYITIQASGMFDSDSYWEYIVRTKFIPAMRNVNYGN